MESRLSHLYDTNNIPSDEELVEIQQLLAPCKAQLAQLDLELKAAEALVARLKAERKAIVASMKPLNRVVSLMRRMPPEIMERIFVQSLPADGYATFNACDLPLVLLRVCRRWREIALNAPELWSSIDLIVPVHLLSTRRSPGPKHQRRVASLLAEVKRWIVRSANYPLSIRKPEISSRHFQGDAEVILDEIYSALVPSSHRWCSGDFSHFPPRVVIPSLNSLSAVSLPMLHHLRLLGYLSAAPSPGPGIPQGEFPYNGLITAPNLKSLHMQTYSGQAYPYRLTSMPVNWSALTSLTFGCVSSYMHRHTFFQQPSSSMWIDILPILDTCTSLQHCALMLPSDRGEVVIPTSHATLPSLVGLHLSGCSDAIDCLLQFIHAPRIQELHYQPLHPRIPTSNMSILPRLPLLHSSPLSSFLQISGSGIEVLSVNVPPLTWDDALHGCLGNTPFLKQLTFGAEFRNHPFLPQSPSDSDPLTIEAENAFIFTDSLLHALTPTRGDEGRSHLCLRLEILRCNDTKCQITEAAVVAFLDAKLDPSLSSAGIGGTRFQELSMNMLQLDAPFGGASDMDEGSALRRFRDAGVKLSFSKTDYCKPTPPSLAGFTLGYGVNFAD